MKSFKIIKVIVLILISLLVLSAFTLGNSSGDKVAFLSDINIPEDVIINGTAFSMFGDVIVHGTVRGDAIALFGNVNIDGMVNGSTVAVMGALDVGDNAVINGDAVGIGGGTIKSHSAVVRGEVIDASFGMYSQDFYTVVTLILGVLLLINYAISSLAIIVMPDRIQYMTSKIYNKVVRSFFIGVITLFMFPLIITALAITIIGIIAIPFFVIAYAIVAYISLIPMSIAIGKLIVPSLETKNSHYIHLLVGNLIITILAMLPVIALISYSVLNVVGFVFAIIGFMCFLILVAIALGVAVDTRIGGNYLKGKV